MIHVDRSGVREPKRFKRLRDAGLQHAREFFVDTPASERRQQRYFNPHWQKAYPVPIPALVRLFHGKRAFCEMRVNADAPGVRRPLAERFTRSAAAVPGVDPSHHPRESEAAERAKRNGGK